METSQITNEAVLGMFAHFLGNKITVFFVSKENFCAYDVNVVSFSDGFLAANVESEQAVTREDIELY